MVRIRILSLTALALAPVLGSGLLSIASAQQTNSAPPAYGSPQYQEPSPGGEIQLYSLPTGPAGTPAMPTKSPELPAETPVMPEPPSRPSPYSYPEPTPQVQYQRDRQYPEDATGPDWSPPGGSVKIEDFQGIRYISGGIGEGERAELEALSNQFNLRLLFAMQDSGNYLGDVQVRILDSRGATILSAESHGPWFFAELPPGSYTVEVIALDQSQRQTTRIDQRQSRLNFYWR